MEVTNTGIWLSNYSLFAEFTPHEIVELASLFISQSFHQGDVIVKEGELVDAIYFIVKGKAEVRTNLQPIALLNSGDSIGLSQTGFFSSTGARTATVLALEEVAVLKLDLAQLHAFLKSHPHANQSMMENANLLLRMHFLKEAAPFSQLPLEYLRKLAEQIDEISLPQGAVIFQQGEQGDSCYLIKSGVVRISIKDAAGAKVLAELESAAIFGEVALLLDLPRNATACVLEDASLLILKKELFLKLIESEPKTTEALMAIQRARSRPQRLQHIEKYRRKMPDGEEIITLKNAQIGKYYRLSKYGEFVWDRLDGRNDLSEVTLAFYNEFDIFSPSMISTLIFDLHQSGFVQLDNRKQADDRSRLSLFAKSLLLLRQIMEVQWTIGNVDGWVTRSYNRYFWPFFTRSGQFILAFIAISGFIIFVYYFSHVANLFSVSPIKWSLMLLTYLCLIPTIILHELAHTYATKSFGHQVNAFGIGWFWLGPVAFCDTSDMWLANKKKRLIVDLAGIYANLIFAGLAGLCMLFIHSQNWMIVLWLFSLITYLAVIANLNPAMEFDGYYALMDILDKPNLRESAIEWLGERVFNKHQVSLLNSIKQHREEVVYWLSMIAFIILMEIVAPLIILPYLFHGLFGKYNLSFNLLIVFAALLFSSISIWIQVKQKKH